MQRRVEQFGALGQRERLKIFRLLVRVGPGGCCVDDIRRRLKTPGSTLSHHLETLNRSGLVGARRSGRFIYYAVNWRETAGLIHFLTVDCCAELHTGFAQSGTRMPCAAAPCDLPQQGAQGEAQRRKAAGMARGKLRDRFPLIGAGREFPRRGSHG